MSNAESISAKLRRWADESEVRGKSKFPSTYALRELGIRKDRGMYWIEERELFRHIADEIDREIDELRESFANQRYVNIEDAVRGVALGIDDHGGTKAAIDRYYLPRPLFEDGEPVYIGAEIDDRKRGKLEVSRICYTDGGFYFNNSRGSNGRKMKGITYKYGERVGRPKQPVLDADGVPIEEGDTMYGTGREQHRYTVQVPYSVNEELGERFLVQCYDHYDGNIVWCDPLMLTHEEPVICADGSRIIVGDKVWWDKGDFNPYTVKSLHPDNVLTSHVEIEASDGAQSYCVHPSHLTHREPDTQERIDRDALKDMYEYWGCAKIGCNKCPALVDGKNPRHRYGVDWCYEATTLDLLRRQRELDGRNA